MAVIVVDDVTEVSDVVELINYLTSALAEGQTDALLSDGTLTLTRTATPTNAQLADMVRLDEVEDCVNSQHRPGCTCIEDAAATDPRHLTLFDMPRHAGPVPYVSCPQRGQHQQLTECWMCWSDVHRGAISIEQALLAK